MSYPGYTLNWNKSTKNNLIEFDTQHVENTWNKVNSKDPYGHGFHHQHSHSHSANIDGFRNLNEPLPIYSMINYIIKFFWNSILII